MVSQTIDSNLGIYGLAFGNGLFMAVGTYRQNESNHGVSLVSRDGQNWQRSDAPSVTNGQLIYANGWFVLGGEFASPDGVMWTQMSKAFRSGLIFDGNQLVGTDGTVIYHSGKIVPPFMVEVASDATGFVLNRTSLGGTDIDLNVNLSVQRRLCSGAVEPLPKHSLVIPAGHASARENYVTGNFSELKVTIELGEAYSIGTGSAAVTFPGGCSGGLQSLSVDNLHREADGSFSLRFDNAPGQDQRGEIEVSEDLRTWVPLKDQQENQFSLKDPGASGRPMRFYRLKPAGP